MIMALKSVAELTFSSPRAAKGFFLLWSGAGLVARANLTKKNVLESEKKDDSSFSPELKFLNKKLLLDQFLLKRCFFLAFLLFRSVLSVKFLQHQCCLLLFWLWHIHRKYQMSKKFDDRFSTLMR